MFQHRFPSGHVLVLVFFCFQVETQGSSLSSSSPLDQNGVPSNMSQNIPAAFPLDAAATVWRIPLRHQNSTFLLQTLWDMQKLRNTSDERKGYWLISVKRHEVGLVEVTPAQPHDFPHKVYLSRNNNNASFFCGGSIISKWLILTAAHCVSNDDDPVNASSLMVTAGWVHHGHLLPRPPGLEQIRVVDEIVVHPNYTRGEGHHDNIAILVLSEPLAFSPAVTSIELPNRDSIFQGNATVSGWGSTTGTASGGDPSSYVLNKVTVPILLNSDCNAQYSSSINVRITELLFCAEEEGLVSCPGDSGGPAVCTKSGGQDRDYRNYSVLCGIVSLREGCGLDAYPGLYVQVSKYIIWIHEVLTNRALENSCLLDVYGGTWSDEEDLTICVSKKYLPSETETSGAHGVSEEPGFLLLTSKNNNKTSLLRIDLSQTEAVERIEEEVPPGSAALGNPTAVDFDLKNNVLYWVDNLTDIKRLYLNNGNAGVPEVLLSSSSSSNNGSAIRGLAFDWMSRNLYFTDSERGTIEVIRTDDDGVPSSSSATHERIMRKQLLTRSDDEQPWGIAVHPELGFIFWTGSDRYGGYIGRAHLDGSHTIHIVWASATISRPTGLALDFDKDRVYWVDADEHQMMSADLNGDDVRIVLEDHERMSAPLAVGIYKNTVYWTDFATLALYKAPLRDDDKSAIVIPDSISKITGEEPISPGDLKVFDGSSQRGGGGVNNLCTNSSSCSYICMASLRPRPTLSCLCPDGFTSCREEDTRKVEVVPSIGKCVAQNLTASSSSDAETRRAREEPGFLLATNALNWVMRINLDLMCVEEFSLDLAAAAPSEGVLSSPEFDLKNNCLYWVDSGGRDIKRLHLSGSGRDPEVLVSLSNGSKVTTGLAFDWISSNLYYFDSRRRTIEVIRTDKVLDSPFHGRRMGRVVLSSPHVNSPSGLAVHPAKGYLFWTESELDNSFICRAHLDGSQPTKIVSNNNSPGVGVPGGGNRVIYSPIEITVDYSGDRIYWKNEFMNCIMSADLNGGDVKRVLVADSGRVSLDAAPFVVYKNRAYWGRTEGLLLMTTPIRHDKTARLFHADGIVIGHFNPLAFKVYGGHSSHLEEAEEHPCTHSNCSYICIASPAAGPQRTASCLCPAGFTSQNNNDTTTDDEGTPSNGGADLTNCVPMRETPPCGVDQEDPELLLVSNGTTLVLRMDSKNQTDRDRVEQQSPFLGSSSSALLGTPTSVDFDLKHNVLYWVDSGVAIKRLQLLSGSSRDPEVVLVSSNQSYFTGLAFDWVSRNLYFALNPRNSGSKIEVLAISTCGSGSGFQGEMRKLLLTQPDVKNPRALAVHPAKGYIFWTDYVFYSHQYSFIGRAHLDGSHATTIVSNANNNSGENNNNWQNTIGWPTGLSVDYSADRIYWMDLALIRIMSADLNGEDVKIVLQFEPRTSGLRTSPASFAFYSNKLYWTDMDTGGLYKAPLSAVSPATTKCRIMGGLVTNSALLKVYGGESQQGEHHPCTTTTTSNSTNNNCSYICMASPGPQGTLLSCLCPDGFTGQNNDTSCV